MANSIKIIDGYPGIGKTNWAIQNINETEINKILYITPYLAEVTRIVNYCQKRNFEEPEIEKGYGRKMTHLLDLVEQGKNIVTTHALFSNMDEVLFRVLKEQNYVLYLDEAIQVIQKFNIAYSSLESEDDYLVTNKKTRGDIATLINKGFIHVEEDGKEIWVNNADTLSPYEDLRKKTNLGLIYRVKDTLLWVFPVQIFKEDLFREIYIMTYRFHSQLQSYYFRFYEVPYKIFFIVNKSGRFELTDNQSLYDEREWKRKIVKHLTILDDNKLNEIGSLYRIKGGREYDTALSKSWYENNKKKEKSKIVRVQKNLENFFKNKTSSLVKERMWTSFKSDVKLIKNKNVNDKYWLAMNARATNEWGNKKYLAYLINRFLDPCYKEYFSRKDIRVDEDEYAVSECIQWIWRSRIRNFEDIVLYMPSARMRILLKNYLEIKEEALGLECAKIPNTIN